MVSQPTRRTFTEGDITGRFAKPGAPRICTVAAVVTLVMSLLVSEPLAMAAVVHASDRAGAATGEELPPQDTEVETLAEQLQRLGDMIREMAKSAADAARSAPGKPRGGTQPSIAAIAPSVHSDNVHEIYGPAGPTVHSVKALLAYRLVLLGNPRLKTGDVSEQDGRIIAEVVTVKEEALVARFMIDPKTGVWVPER